MLAKAQWSQLTLFFMGFYALCAEHNLLLNQGNDNILLHKLLCYQEWLSKYTCLFIQILGSFCPYQHVRPLFLSISQGHVHRKAVQQFHKGRVTCHEFAMSTFFP